jgi:hypothetical protein
MISHSALHSSAMASPTQPTFFNLRRDQNMSCGRSHQENSSANPPIVSTASTASSPRSHQPTYPSHAHTSSAKMTRSLARHSTSCRTSTAASSQIHRYLT